MTTEIRQRNMVERLDGRMVNAGRLRGMLLVCVNGCCCGLTDRGFAPVPTDLYHAEWERRKLRNRIHLNQSGCLGPCVLANVAMLLVDGRPYWFHSINADTIIIAIYDYIERLLANSDAPLPALLQPHLFNGFAWDGAQVAPVPAKPATMTLGDGILVLSQADTDLLTLTQARALLPAGFAPVQSAQVGRLADDAAVDALLDQLLPAAQIVVARLHSTRSFAYGLERLHRWATATNGFLLCLPAVEAFDPDLMGRSNVGVPLAQAISVYFQCGGAQNLANGLQCLSDHLLVTGWGFEPPEELPLHGIYETGDTRYETRDTHPTGSRETSVSGLESPVSSLVSPTVGLLFYRSNLLSGNTAFVDAIMAAFKRRGMAVCAVYTQSLKESDADGFPLALKFFASAGVDAIVSTLSFALGDGGEAFTQLDVPVFQAITASIDHAAWQRNGRGLSPLDTAMNVAIPEFDGRIISVPVTFKEALPDGGARYAPDQERIQRLVGLVERMVTLRRKPNAEKRIAFVFTNSAAKAARVGNAVGLDAPASLLDLLHRMQREGYTITDLPADSDTLLHQLIDRCSYDTTWLTDGQLARAHQLPVTHYQAWFDAAPASNRRAMVRQWGEPPGKAYTHNGNFALAGLAFGNAFVALQPPRGYDMNPDEVYHRPDLPPPHNYYALYRWLREEWGADAIVHMGKYGTLEWLPGKSVGLSNECFPDLFLDDLPLIYPFIINDPGEGSQAKRRTHATIIDHMTPPMTSAGAYGALAELAQLVDEYYTAEQLDPAKLPLLQRQIWEVIQRNRLDDDLRYLLSAAPEGHPGDHSHDWDGAFLEDGTPTAFAELQGAQVAHLLEDIEGYLCELTGAQIRDGLHILGYMAAGEQLVELLYHLLKLPNVQAPSLPATVARLWGEDWGALQAAPGARRADWEGRGQGMNKPGRPTEAELVEAGVAPASTSSASDRLPVSTGAIKTNADLIAAIERESKALLTTMGATGWDVAAVDGVLAGWALGMNSQPDRQNPLKRVGLSSPLQRASTCQPPISIGGAEASTSSASALDQNFLRKHTLINETALRYKVVTLPTPWNKATETFQYLLVQCGTPVPEGYPDLPVIEVPVKRVITMSSTQLPHLLKLNRLDVLVGHENFQNVNMPEVRALIDAGKLVEVGSGATVNVEVAIDAAPDLTLPYSLGNPEQDAHPKLIEAGLPVVLTAEYMETAPLGRVEWVKFMALFLNEEARANVSFAGTAERYQAMAKVAKAELAAYQSGNIYNNNARLNEFGSNDYWENGLANPDVVLADLIKILHPELLPDHELVYYRHLAATSE